MKRQIACLLISSLLLSCADQSTQSPPEETTIATTTQACYSYLANRDTVLLEMIISGTLVRGTLTYQLFEKDTNKGSVRGTLHGDTIFADYRFASEGIASTREIVFLKKESTLIEGYGEMEEKNGKMIFRNRQEITFGKGVVLKMTECNK